MLSGDQGRSMVGGHIREHRHHQGVTNLLHGHKHEPNIQHHFLIINCETLSLSPYDKPQTMQELSFQPNCSSSYLMLTWTKLEISLHSLHTNPLS